MNLIINAVEAIGDAGVVQVRTGRRTVTTSRWRIVFGERVRAASMSFWRSDNRSGMDEQTIRKIFDPFFTTKFTGRGLGLAAVLGIVRQHKGIVQVHSVPGRGTSFRVLFRGRGGDAADW